MALLTKQTVNLAGLTPVYSAVSASDTFTAGNNVFLHVKNGNAGACTVAVVTPGTVSGQAVADLSVVVPATTGDKMIGPLPGSLFTASATGLVTATFSVTTTVTAALLELDPDVAS